MHNLDVENLPNWFRFPNSFIDLCLGAKQLLFRYLYPLSNSICVPLLDIALYEFIHLAFSALLNMQSIRISVLRHVRVSGSAESWLLAEKQNVLKRLSRQMCSSTVTCPDQIMDRVIGLVKKFDKIDASKVMNGILYQYRLYYLSILKMFLNNKPLFMLCLLFTLVYTEPCLFDNVLCLTQIYF